MSPELRARLHRRAQGVRARARVRRWEYRQRDLAAGVWFRLRRVLCAAEAAFVISDEDARRLLVEGYLAEPCGGQIAPAKTIVFVPPGRVATLVDARPTPVGLTAEFLAARAVALVRFPGPP